MIHLRGRSVAAKQRRNGGEPEERQSKGKGEVAGFLERR
jgi:hypothetical protein